MHIRFAFWKKETKNKLLELVLTQIFSLYRKKSLLGHDFHHNSVHGFTNISPLTPESAL